MDTTAIKQSVQRALSLTGKRISELKEDNDKDTEELIVLFDLKTTLGAVLRQSTELKKIQEAKGLWQTFGKG